METLKAEKIGALPFKNLHKICDLIYYEGPILSHFKDDYNKDIMFYWVDQDENLNRWLLLQITEKQLYKYLVRELSLKNIFDNPVNDIFYSVEIDNSVQYNNIVQIFKEDLPTPYIPEPDYFFKLKIPEVYNKLIKTFEDNYAKVVFMDSSLYMKAQPAKRENLNLVGILDGADFLYGLGNSFKGLIEYETTKEFVKRGIADSKRIDKATTALVRSMQPNIINAEAASFAIAISPNSFTDVGVDFLNKKWRDQLFMKFKTDIIEIDKKNSDDIENILQMYGGNNTTDIYKPLIELYNNTHLILSITDKEFNAKRTIRPIKKEYVNKLIVRKAKDIEEPEDRIAKVKYNKKTGKIAGTAGATLFDQSIYTAWKTQEIRTELKTYKLRHTLPADYKYENKLHIIENDELDIYATGDSLPEAETNFYDEFDKLYKQLIDVENVQLTAREIEIKRYLQFHLNG